jgi:hypothetical protein
VFDLPRYVVALLAVCAVHVLHAQVRQQVYPEKLHQDVDAIAALVHEVHPDPYRYMSRVEMDQVVRRVKDSIRVPLDAEQFMAAVLPIFHAVGDAQFVPELPAAVSRLIGSRVPLLPLKVRILEQGVFVEEELKGFRSIPSGSQVLSINGLDMPALLARLSACIVADGANTSLKMRRIEQDLPRLYAQHIGRGASFTIRYIPPKGEEQEDVVFAITGEEMLRSRKPMGTAMLPWGATWEQESGAMWVNLRTLDPDTLARAGQRADRFLEALLADLREKKVRTLVIDLRGAGGNDLAFAEQVFASLALQPFRLGAVQVKEPGSTDHPQLYAYLSGAATRSSNAITQGDLKEPMPKAFQGKVYVLCDGLTRGTAAAFVMTARRTGRARIFGEETGSNAYSFTTGPELLVTLPNVQVQVHVPLVRVIPEGKPAGPLDRGEVPNHLLTTDPRSLAMGQDGVKRALLRLIRELN